MTAKRFMVDDAGELIDLNNHKFIDYGEECCNLLNEQHETIERLKDNCKVLDEVKCEIAEENEQLKQFKEYVFNKIDMHLRMLPTARDNEFNEYDGDPSLYTGAIYMLETLKKELKE